MLFTSRINIVRRLITTGFAKQACCGMLALSFLGTPNFAMAKNPIFDASEYEEWGLDYPGATPPATSQSDSEVPAERPASQRPASQTPTREASVPTGGQVPEDIAGPIQRTAVHVILFYADGKHMMMPGWIVDAERRIIMTLALMDDAVRIHIAYPQVTDAADDSMEGSEAVLLKYESNMDVAYLQAKKMPEELLSLGVSRPTHGQAAPQRPVVSHKPTPPAPPQHGSHQGGHLGSFNGALTGGGQSGHGGGIRGGGQHRPAQANNPLVGSWYLSDTVQGTQIAIGAAFDAQGNFAFKVQTMDAYGRQTVETNQGTYRVRGNTVILNSSEGIEEVPFWFENGCLYVNLVSEGTTLIFQAG